MTYFSGHVHFNPLVTDRKKALFDLLHLKIGPFFYV